MTDAPRAVVVATRSRGKRDEWRALLEEAGIVVEDLNEVGLAEDAAEDGLEIHDSFEENARAKARWFGARLPGRAVIADDSGLVVDALGGAPGVRSKRWAGSSATGAALDAANNAALLLAMRAHAAVDARRARYVCAVVCAVVCVEGAHEWVARGACEGRILHEARGASGFGYDPFFWSDDLARTFGEATREEKASVSHRGRAMRALAAQWRTAREV